MLTGLVFQENRAKIIYIVGVFKLSSILSHTYQVRKEHNEELKTHEATVPRGIISSSFFKY